MKRTYVFAIAALLAFLVPALVKAQSPPVPEKSPQALAAPSKALPQAAPFASPQAALASPQQSYAPQQSFAPVQQYDTPVQALVLRAPAVYQIQRQVLLQAAPVVSYQTVQAAPVAFAEVAYDTGCAVGVQQAVVQRSFVQHSAVLNRGVVHQAQVNHGLIGAGAGRAPRKVVTKQVTKTKGRGLFGRR
jgi:hypothetical protein